jgi:hypothetical protein
LCSLGKSISTFFKRSFGVLFRDFPILGSLFEIVAVLLCPTTALTCTVPAAFASTTFVAGVTSGNLGTALKAGLIAAATAAAFYEVGNLTDAINGSPIGSHTAPAFGSDAYAFNVAGHALVGCASAAASGGNCGAAALAGGITSAATPFFKGLGFAGGLVANAVLGGLASVAGGGKFANGAITGAFGYLFNACGAQFGCTGVGLLSGAGAGATAALGCDVVTVGVCAFGNPLIVAGGAFVGGTIGLAADAVDAVRSWLAGTIFASSSPNVPPSVGPGPYAGTPIPAGPSSTPTAEQQGEINAEGDANGCHTCGTTDPGTKSGNWVGDHQPPTALNPPGNPQVYYPQCLSCSNAQGGLVRALKYP